MKDEDFINLVNLCAEQHGCKISNINFDEHIIELDGPEDKQLECAIAIEDLFGRYTA